MIYYHHYNQDCQRDKQCQNTKTQKSQSFGNTSNIELWDEYFFNKRGLCGVFFSMLCTSMTFKYYTDFSKQISILPFLINSLDKAGLATIAYGVFNALNKSVLKNRCDELLGCVLCFYVIIPKIFT